MSRMRSSGPWAPHWVLVLLLVAVAAVLATLSQAWESAVTAAAAVYGAVASGQDRGSRP